MNAFERHNIRHLSASSLNTWAAQPALWVMERLLKKSAPVGSAAFRGTAIEAGVTAGLLDLEKPIEDCQAIALAEFSRLTALSGDPNREKEQAAIAPTVETALKELRLYGRPDECQVKIERTLPGVSVPLIGYLDFGYPNHGITIDLKTSLRLTSEISDAHARQVAGYVYGTNREARVAYATPKKIGVYRLENPAEHIEAVRQIACRLERFLAISADPAELAAILTPDYGSFYWNNATARANGREVYGF